MVPRSLPGQGKLLKYFEKSVAILCPQVLQDNRLVDLPLSNAFLKLICHGEVHNCVDERIGTPPTREEDIMTSSYISEESEKDWELESPRREAAKPW